MINYGECPKHKCSTERVEVGRGKTMEVCPKCEKERLKKFDKFFKKD